MRRDREFKQMALQISIALSAGMFSIMPSVSAAPVLDHVVSGGAVVDQKTTPNVTDISSKARNNVVDWKDFSVAQGEMVRFDGGEKTNNYLNVVSGANVSQIDGAIKGGDNVYIVNPNGVVFGNSASVDVGSLYVSSRPLNAVDYEKTDANGDMQPLLDTASVNGGDIVNMGTVQANSVFLEGGNIVIGEVNRIRTADGSEVNNNVTIQTNGNITLGKSVSSIVAENNAKANAQNNSQITEDKAVAKANTVTDNAASTSNTVTDNAASTGGYTYTLKSAANVLPLIYDEEDFINVSTDCVGQAADYTYTLKKDLDFKKDGAPPFTPIANFKSTFDGEFHTIKNITYTGEYGGLFSTTDGATIKNVGVSGGTITATTAGGGLVGKAVNTSLINVFNGGTTITYSGDYNMPLGGIVGDMEGGKIDTAYNTADIGAAGGTKSGAIVGRVKDVTTITHVYNTGTAAGGLVAAAQNKSSDKTKLSDAYTTNGKIHGTNISNSVIGANVIQTTIDSTNKESKYADYYESKLSSISNEGGLDPTDSPWRIYEGQSLPLLRAFLTGHGTVTVNYDYTQGKNKSGSNNSADLEVTYNNNDIYAKNVKYYQDGAEITPEYTINGADGSLGRDVRYRGSGNDLEILSHAAFYTGQQGYDLVGNNVTIKQREVTVSSDFTGKHITKEYDGTADASSAAGSLFYGDEATSDTGIIKGDTTVSLNTSGVTATFVKGENDSTASPDVGGNKWVKISGTLSLDNAAGKQNYKLTSTSLTLPETIFDGNSITQKSIVVSLNNPTNIDKTYDGKTTVLSTYAPSEQFTNVVNGIKTGTDSSGQAVYEQITLGYDENAYYVDKDGTKASKAGTYNGVGNNGKVEYGGIYIVNSNGYNSKNYKLVDSEGNPIYSEKVEGLAGTGEYSYYDDNGNGFGRIYGTGQITKKNISSKGFSWYNDTTKMDAEREYNRESSFTEYTVKDSAGNIIKDADGNDEVIAIKDKYVSNSDAVENTDYTLGSGETFSAMLNDELDLFKIDNAVFINTLSKPTTNPVSDSYATDVTGDKGAQGVLYTVTVSQSAKDNYTLDNADITDDQITLVGKGSITPRTVNLIHNTSDAARAEKEYDGNSDVKRNNSTSFNTINGDADFLIYADNADTKHHLLTGDENAITVTGQYYDGATADGNVNYANGQVLDKKIVYTAAVTGGNYIIVNKDKDTNTISNTFTVDLDANGNGMGRINQREINELEFAAVSKTYDGEYNVTNSKSAAGATFATDDVISITGAKRSNGDNALVGTDTVATIFNIGTGTGAKITGEYGTLTGTTWNPNENANPTKDVKYELQNGLLTNNNYKLNLATGNIVYAVGGGKIDKLTITPEDIRLARNDKSITDIYDGTGKVDNPTQYLDYGTNNKAAWVAKDDKTLNIDVGVKNANYATIHSKNKAEQLVTYNLTIDNTTGNYEVKNGSTLADELSVSKDANGKDIKGIITPRPITIYTSGANQNVSDNLTKTYDAKTEAKTTGEDLLAIENQLVEFDQNKNRNGIVANYAIPVQDADGNITGYSSLDKNVSGEKAKAVVYTLGINAGTDGDASDYYFRAGENGTAITEYVGAGTINPLRMKVGVDSSVSPSKVFDGKTDVPTDKMPAFAKYIFTEVDKDGNSLGDVASVVDLDGFDTNIGNIKGTYGYNKADGTFEPDANVTDADKVVQYTGVLDALGENQGNYIVENTFYGTGKITPATIDETAFKFVLKGNITKTYSGDSAVAEYGMSDLSNSAEVIDAFQRSWVDGGNDDKTGSGVFLTDGTFIKLSDGAYTYTILQGADAPKFTSGGQEVINAGGNYDVTYKILISPESFKNYKYKPTTGSGLTEETPIPMDASTKGTILQRVIEVAPTHESLTKTYDGTDAIYNNDNRTWSGDTASGTVLTGENALKFTSGAAAYDSSLELGVAQKGLISGTNASTGAYADVNAGENKTINYTGKVTGTDGTDLTSNYTFVGTTATTQNVINPFGISIKANDINKTYDNTTGVTKEKAQSAFTNTVLGDVLGAKPGDSADEVVFKSGIFTDTTGAYDNPNVKLSDGSLTHKVTYSGLALSSDNYKLVAEDGSNLAYNENTKTYSVEGKGTIDPLALTSIEMTAGKATKTYDGTKDVKNVDGTIADKDKNYLTGFTVNGQDWLNNISYSAEYNSKHVNDANSVVYTLGMGLSDNYTITPDSNLLKENENGGHLVKAEDGQYQWIETHNGDTITPRELVVNQAGEIAKVYDGYSTVKDADNKFYLSDEDMAVLAKDGITKNVVANYVEADGTTLHINASDNPINVHYDVTLSDNTHGDYTLKDASGDTTGTISRRPVNVIFDSSAGKDYDGDDTVTDKGTFKLEKKNGDRGIVDKDADKQMEVDASGITAKFADDGNVKRDANGNVTAQTINYTGAFALTNPDASLTDNYIIDESPTTGLGVITPKKVKLTIDEQPVKEYDGTTAIKNSPIIGTTLNTGNEALDNDAILYHNGVKDDIQVFIAGGNYADANAGTDKKYNYTVNWDNGNYVIVQDYNDAASLSKSAQINGTDGIIDQRLLQVTVPGKAEKEYDGTNAVLNAQGNLNVGAGRVVNNDNLKLSVTGVYDNPNAGKDDDSGELLDHVVTYTLNLGNSNYKLDNYTVTGNGTITRKAVTVAANPVSMNAGASLPQFSGKVQGLLAGDSAVGNLLTYGLPAGTNTSAAGEYAVYGWYRGRNYGNLGQNYTFTQSPTNEKALTVSGTNTDMENLYNQISEDITKKGNPDTKITPNGNVYNQISKDMGSGFGDNGAAAIEYQDKSGNVVARENIGSGAIHGIGLEIESGAGDMSDQSKGVSNIGIVGGDIVNMEGADAAGSASIELSGDGTTVNLEVFSINGEENAATNNSVAEISNVGGRGGIGTITSADGTVNIGGNAGLDNDTTDAAGSVDVTNSANNSVAGIEIIDDKKNILEEENEDKVDKEKKEGEIAIKSSDGENEDEIELKMENDGVNVA